jgi:hypothetical protein
MSIGIFAGVSSSPRSHSDTANIGVTQIPSGRPSQLRNTRRSAPDAQNKKEKALNTIVSR